MLTIEKHMLALPLTIQDNTHLVELCGPPCEDTFFISLVFGHILRIIVLLVDTAVTKCKIFR